VFISLAERVAAAHTAGADLFISMHADAIANAGIRGLSVYTLSERSSDQEAAALAERENKVDLLAGIDLSHESPEVSNILIDLAQRESMNLSARLAGFIVRELHREVKLLPKSHRFARFAVLKSPDIPSVLIEMGYLSNPVEEALLRKPTYRAKLAGALVRSVDDFFRQTHKVARP
ncbi:MAG: N-acetylmuramoyl-L-alanine amidase, partial [Alphaproteobacteria bacterium]|nr:N-acetylmuramoyl-L-alanine amidase [Alphaproteobacteria bacterium]